MALTILHNWPKWRFFNCWSAVYDIHTFCLFSFWWTNQVFGATFLNFGVEYNRKAGK